MSATPTTSPTTCGPRLLRTIGRDPTSSRLQSRRRRRNHYRRIAPRGHPSWPPHGVVASKQAAVCTARVSKSIARQRNAISNGNDHSALLKLGIQGVNSPRVWIGCAGFTISGVTNSSAIYARTDASGDVTKLHHKIPEVRASMLSGGTTRGHGDVRQSPRASHLMTAKSPGGRRLHRLAAEFHQLASGR